MNRVLLTCMLLATFLLKGNSPNFDPKVASKSLVKVMVTSGTKMGVCSGFVWKNTNWVVTNLHAMKPNGKIEIAYQGGATREAEIRSIYAAADLVLLELKPTEPAPPATVVALTTFQPRVSYNEEIHAIGYHGGSRGNQTQKLYKGGADPENLLGLVPKDVTQSLNIPEGSFPIYFLMGSLLPGFSGSPVYNSKGELIGIGDGGLERGQMNVSWCIPASNLKTLEESDQKDLPPGFEKIALHYSAEVYFDVADPAENPKSNGGDGPLYASAPSATIHDETYSYKGMEFYWIKNRSWNKMKSTAIYPTAMNNFTREFEDNGLHLDTGVLFYDVYEDILKGFIVAVPEETPLIYDENYGMFGANMDSLPFGEYFTLNYNTFQNTGNPTEALINEYRQNMGAYADSLKNDVNYSSTVNLSSTWKIDYRLLQANIPYQDPATPDQFMLTHLLIYLTVVYSETEAFYAMAQCAVPLHEEEIVDALVNGIDCRGDYEATENACDFFESLTQVCGAAHLTSHSNQY